MEEALSYRKGAFGAKSGEKGRKAQEQSYTPGGSSGQYYPMTRSLQQQQSLTS